MRRRDHVVAHPQLPRVALVVQAEHCCIAIPSRGRRNSAGDSSHCSKEPPGMPALGGDFRVVCGSPSALLPDSMCCPQYWRSCRVRRSGHLHSTRVASLRWYFCEGRRPPHAASGGVGRAAFVLCVGATHHRSSFHATSRLSWRCHSLPNRQRRRWCLPPVDHIECFRLPARSGFVWAALRPERLFRQTAECAGRRGE